jgi:hypothetical protein
MKHNLMGKEKIENLGYTEVNTYENEEQVSQLNYSSPHGDNLAQKSFIQKDMRDR